MSQTFSLQRSRALLKEQGYDTWIVEKPYNQWTKRREDLFNLFDLVGIRGDMAGVCGVQACGEEIQDHIRKVLEGFRDRKGNAIPPNPYISTWLKAGNRAFMWALRLRKHEGTKPTFQLREIEFLLENGQVVHRENQVKLD